MAEYVVAHKSDASYITPGKRYYTRPGNFECNRWITDDVGERCCILIGIRWCPHLGPENKWRLGTDAH